MDYKQAIDFLYGQLPMFERQGGTAYKPGLETSLALDRWTGEPHLKYKTIHVAGTNGKGSTCHLLAASLQQAGYRVGLYTSPHLVDFRERIRVNGTMIEKGYVVDFMERYFNSGLDLQPTFFEFTTALALEFFASQKVDIAVIETGMGGRLDSTNIITPLISVITNISLDHTQFLGDTLPKIASEKAGIIKEGVPVVIGECDNKEVRKVFEEKAAACHAPITFACDRPQVLMTTDEMEVTTRAYGSFVCQLKGEYQMANINTALVAIREMERRGLATIGMDAVETAFGHVCELTGLQARWMVLGKEPTVVCDTGHNVGGWEYLSSQLRQVECDTLRMVIGFVADKDIESILTHMPSSAQYYFTQPDSHRALAADELAERARKVGLEGECYDNGIEAFGHAMAQSSPHDFIFVGGSTYLVGELLEWLKDLGE